MKVVAFLPVKGNSSRITNKNIQLLDGKPLFLHQLEKLLSLNCIHEVYLDTESEYIMSLASHTNCKILRRDPKLSTNETDGNQLLINEIMQVSADIYLQILCTSPFIDPSTIKDGIDKLINSMKYDSVVLIKREKQYSWNPESYSPNYDYNKIPNSSELPDSVIETMGLYIIRREAALTLGRRIGKKPFLLDASPTEAVDVNYPSDFELANYIAAGKREQERKLFRNISGILSSSMLADILEEENLSNQILTGFKLNMSRQKILGRAKTLKIQRRQTNEKKSIYDALKSYDFVVPNDIIVVENECPDYAYFGYLNANLAIRSGAIGAIIGGVTRDHNDVQRLNFPVFSLGNSCIDIKNQGVLGYTNKPIQIKNTIIYPEDLIFGDNEGIVVFPKKSEKKILSRCINILSKENSIVAEVAQGIAAQDLVGRHGFF